MVKGVYVDGQTNFWMSTLYWRTALETFCRLSNFKRFIKKTNITVDGQRSFCRWSNLYYIMYFKMGYIIYEKVRQYDEPIIWDADIAYLYF